MHITDNQCQAPNYFENMGPKESTKCRPILLEQLRLLKPSVPILGKRGVVRNHSSGGASPGTRSIAVADVNQDGKPDLLLGNNFFTVAVLLGIGDGTFQAADLYNAGTPSPFCVVSDVNGDGRPSIRAKVLSRTKISCAVPKHCVVSQRG
jgi:FG-GAP-like repeat